MWDGRSIIDVTAPTLHEFAGLVAQYSRGILMTAWHSRGWAQCGSSAQQSQPTQQPRRLDRWKSLERFSRWNFTSRDGTSTHSLQLRLHRTDKSDHDRTRGRTGTPLTVLIVFGQAPRLTQIMSPLVGRHASVKGCSQLC